jgi:hypothetical protein
MSTVEKALYKNSALATAQNAIKHLPADGETTPADAITFVSSVNV